MIAEDLLSYLISTAPAQRVRDVRIGARYTGVMLEDGNVGVAYTFRQGGAANPDPLLGGSSPIGRTTTELLPYLGSEDGLRRTVGLAVANAMANRLAPDQQEGDVLEFLSAVPADRVGMVGYFGPLVGPLERRVNELVIFERDLGRAPGVRPAEEAFAQLRHCDVAIITATALVFGDIDGLLEAASGCREVALVGASTPLAAAVFAPRGVTLLSGVVVVDGPGMLQVVGGGAGTKAFGARVRKVNIRT